MKDARIPALLTAILEVTGVTHCDICSSSRKKNIVLGRAIFCQEMRFSLGYSCGEVRLCLGRSHSAISHLTLNYFIDPSIHRKIRIKQAKLLKS